MRTCQTHNSRIDVRCPSKRPPAQWNGHSNPHGHAVACNLALLRLSATDPAARAPSLKRTLRSKGPLRFNSSAATRDRPDGVGTLRHLLTSGAPLLRERARPVAELIGGFDWPWCERGAMLLLHPPFRMSLIHH